MSEATKEVLKTANLQHDLENIIDEVIDMLPETDDTHTALYHFVESYNLRFGENYQLIAPTDLSFNIDRIQFYLNQLKKLKG